MDFVPTENVQIKSIKHDYENEFLAFMENFIKDKLGMWGMKKEAHKEFIADSCIRERYFPLKKFGQCLQTYAGRMEYAFYEMKNKKENIGERDHYYFILDTKGTSEKSFEAKFIKGEIF